MESMARSPTYYAASMQPGNLESRVTALEGQMRELRGAARVLAGAADRDVSEIHGEVRDFRRATVASINALRDDMTDMRQEMRSKFDLAATGQQNNVELIQVVIDAQGGHPPA